MSKNETGPMCDAKGPSIMSMGGDGVIAREHMWDLGWALMMMRTGKKVFRAGWNGKGMWLRIQYPDLQSKMSDAYIYLHTTRNRLVPWVASQEDMMACDWEVVKE